MRASAVTKSLTAASANVIAHSQSLAGAGLLTLTSSPVTLDSQRRVIITSAGDDSGLTWTVIGTDDTGNPIKDIFAGANGIAASNIDFKTVVSIFGSGATASTVTAGTNTTGSSPWKMFADTISTPNMSLYAQLVSGSGTATVEYTYDPFESPIPANGSSSSIANGPASPNPVAVPHPSMQGMTASTEGNINYTIHGYRLTITVGTGVWKLTTRQAGLASP